MDMIFDSGSPKLDFEGQGHLATGRQIPRRSGLSTHWGKGRNGRRHSTHKRQDSQQHPGQGQHADSSTSSSVFSGRGCGRAIARNTPLCSACCFEPMGHRHMCAAVESPNGAVKLSHFHHDDMLREAATARRRMK